MELGEIHKRVSVDKEGAPGLSVTWLNLRHLADIILWHLSFSSHSFTKE